ncbi:hypothetical protein ABIE27_002831 [Paenibacillus sp. 4624]|nr:hypothetical protein [Paenibacillus amylolyticus]
MDEQNELPGYVERATVYKENSHLAALFFDAHTVEESEKLFAMKT